MILYNQFCTYGRLIFQKNHVPVGIMGTQLTLSGFDGGTTSFDLRGGKGGAGPSVRVKENMTLNTTSKGS